MSSNPDFFKRPLTIGILAFIIGLALGLVLAWGIWPVEWTDASADLLRSDLQEDYIRMTVDSFSINHDEALAVFRYQQLGTRGPETLQKVKAAPGKLDKNVLLAFEQVLQQKGGSTAQETPAATEPPAFSLVSVFIILGALVAVGLVAGASIWLLRGQRRGGELTPAQQAQEHNRSLEKTDYTTTGQEPPIAQYVTTYVIGDDLFDDSFSIDAPSGEFLGECGVGISETIGVGDPKKVTAFEVWMFDKNDIQTVTKVLMSTHAFTDQAFRAKLEAKGELLELAPQQQVILETQTLQMVATVADMQYGQSPLPDNSYCERLTLELAIWSKK